MTEARAAAEPGLPHGKELVLGSAGKKGPRTRGASRASALGELAGGAPAPLPSDDLLVRELLDELLAEARCVVGLPEEVVVRDA